MSGSKGADESAIDRVCASGLKSRFTRVYRPMGFTDAPSGASAHATKGSRGVR